MLGLWDTVAAFGLSRNVLSVIDWQQLNLRYKLSIPPSVDYVCHAVAIDEKREAFYPTLATPGKQNADRSNIEEVWFAGNHGDVGGGWTDDRGLADVTLRFMASRAMQHGLRFDGTMLPAGEVSGAETVHEADEKDLEKFGRKEREIHVLAFDGKMDVEATDTPKVHQSVFDRLRANSGYRPPNLLRNGSLAQLEQRVEIVPWAPEPDIA